jgi:hypothetical protein
MIEVTPEIGVPFCDSVKYMDLRERADACCNTAVVLGKHGLSLVPTSEDDFIAASLVRDYAGDEERTSKSMTNAKTARMTPASLVEVKLILDEFGHKVAEDAAALRNLINNKLIKETDHADPRVRLKAIELLGKTSDVGMFVEKTEKTITHRTEGEIKGRLRNKLERLLKEETYAEEAQIFEQLDKEVIEGEVVDGTG